MPPPATDLRDRFRGCLLGLAIGDALGGKFEAQSADAIRARFPSVDALIAYPQEEIWYTDDTQMAIGVAETLVYHREIIEEHLCKAFVGNYVPSRGYGRGARAVLEAMEEGRDYRQVGERYFPGGSYGNGAAIRVAPVGLFFAMIAHACGSKVGYRLCRHTAIRWALKAHSCCRSALPCARRCSRSTRGGFFRDLLAACTSDEYRSRLELVSKVTAPADLAQLGNRIEALDSVLTAIASFALTPDSFESTIANVIFLGGDTDTLATMAGGLSGTYLGSGRLPQRLVSLIESSPKGRAYLIELADKLLGAYHELGNETSRQQNG
jgi:poly(ADP-ribose) glycohydrolase ARH3